MKYSLYILVSLFLLLFFSCKKEATQNNPKPVSLSGKWQLEKENIIQYSYPYGVKRIDTFVYKTGIFTTTVPDTPNPIIHTINIVNSLQFNADSSFISSDGYLSTSTLSNGTPGFPGYATDTIRGYYKIKQNKLEMVGYYAPLGLEYNDDYSNVLAGNSDSLPFNIIHADPNIQVTTLTNKSMVLHTDYTYTYYNSYSAVMLTASNTNVAYEFITDYYYTR